MKVKEATKILNSENPTQEQLLEITNVFLKAGLKGLAKLAQDKISPVPVLNKKEQIEISTLVRQYLENPESVKDQPVEILLQIKKQVGEEL